MRRPTPALPRRHPQGRDRPLPDQGRRKRGARADRPACRRRLGEVRGGRHDEPSPHPAGRGGPRSGELRARAAAGSCAHRRSAGRDFGRGMVLLHDHAARCRAAVPAQAGMARRGPQVGMDLAEVHHRMATLERCSRAASFSREAAVRAPCRSRGTGSHDGAGPRVTGRARPGLPGGLRRQDCPHRHAGPDRCGIELHVRIRVSRF